MANWQGDWIGIWLMEKKPKDYALSLDGDWVLKGTVTDDEAMCLDIMIFGNVARFLNHDVKTQIYWTCSS
jgi:hypothetical protein